MTNELEITRGGVLAVNVDTMRSFAARLRTAQQCIRHATGRVHEARREVEAIPEAHDRGYRLMVLSSELRHRADALDDAAHSTQLMADAYEITEYRARLAFERALDTRSLVELRRSLAMVEGRASEGAASLADDLVATRERERERAFTKQSWGAGIFGPAGVMFVSLMLKELMKTIQKLGMGVRGVAAQGDAREVELHAGVTSYTDAPDQLAAAFDRIPKETAQVRVERYVMPDGSKQFVAYIAGTRAIAGADPWNMQSNLELYREGQVSTSLQATKQALHAAGATANDQVHLIGHSQGGMIAGHLGMGDEFNVRSVITAGSPIEPVLGDQVLSVQLRHSDDPVSALAGGGSPAGTGSPQSFVAEREGDAAVGPGDLLLPMHHLDTYIETARMVDLAGDGRAASLHQLWKQLGTARSVTATEYSAVIPTAQLLAPGDVNNAV
jgi:hypothetical protein